MNSTFEPRVAISVNMHGCAAPSVAKSGPGSSRIEPRGFLSRRTASPSIQVPRTFLDAILSQTKVSSCPHDLYKYPARFAPEFAHEAIKAYSEVGDTVLDVFNGGGTTMVEAMALGRKAVGYDISQLACFIARTRTASLSVHDERALTSWIGDLEMNRPGAVDRTWNAEDTTERYYQRNLPEDSLAFFAAVIEQLSGLDNVRQREFARLILLSVGQWALDCRTTAPTVLQMHDQYCKFLVASARAFRGYTRTVAKNLGVAPMALSSLRTIVRASSELCGQGGRPPHERASLIVTSPPYPGVHVLYHRWQIRGRRETPAPFVIADCRDGDGSSYYNLGRRFEPGQKTYYDRLTQIFIAARKCITQDACVIQMVAFNQPDWQLPAYLTAMSAAGYEQLMPELPSGVSPDGNLWRAVPGRKWYAATSKHRSNAAREVVLFHRPMMA